MLSTPSVPNHRHYKTLIVLVISMTCVTFFLFWIGQATPVTKLHGKAAQTPSWNKIDVRVVQATQVPSFYHFKIDDAGRLYRTDAWDAGQPDPTRSGAIEIVLTTQRPLAELTSSQTITLSRTIADLQKTHRIPDDHVVVLPTGPLVSADSHPLGL